MAFTKETARQAGAKGLAAQGKSPVGGPDLAQAKAVAAAKAQAAMAAPTVATPRQEADPEFDALARAAEALPGVDDLLVSNHPRQADLLDLKLAGLKAGGLGVAAARRQTTREDVSRHSAVKGDVRGSVAGVTINREGPGFIVMYDAFGNGRSVPEQDFRACLHTNQLFYVCPLCGSDHLNEDGSLNLSPNACPAKDAVKGIRCPICRQHGTDKVLWDNGAETARAVALPADDDPNIIDSGDMVQTTPEQRLRSALADHIAAFHPAEGRAMGIDVDRINAQFAQQAAQAQAAFVSRAA